MNFDAKKLSGFITRCSVFTKAGRPPALPGIQALQVMQFDLLLAVIGLLIGSGFAYSSGSPAQAEAMNAFPGKGSQADWKKSQVDYDLAHKYKEQENYKAAVEAFQRAIRTYPYDDSYYASRASCYRKLGDNQKAKQDAGRALYLREDPIYWMMVADIAADQHDFETCPKAANSALALAATNSGVYGLITKMQGKWKRMATTYGDGWWITNQKMKMSELGVSAPDPKPLPVSKKEDRPFFPPESRPKAFDPRSKSEPGSAGGSPAFKKFAHEGELKSRQAAGAPRSSSSSSSSSSSATNSGSGIFPDQRYPMPTGTSSTIYSSPFPTSSVNKNGENKNNSRRDMTKSPFAKSSAPSSK